MSGLGVIIWSPSANAQQAVTLGKFVPTIQVLKVYQGLCSDLCASWLHLSSVIYGTVATSNNNTFWHLKD